MTLNFIQLLSMFEDLQPYIPLLESYLQAANKEEFLFQVHDPLSRTLLDLFTSPIITLKDFREKASKLQLSHQLTQQLLRHKLKTFADTAVDCSNKEIMKEIKKQFHDPSSSGEYLTNGENAQVDDNRMGVEESSEIFVVIQEDFQKYLEKKILQEDESFIKIKINQYGLSRLSTQFIAALPLDKKQAVIERYLSDHNNFCPKEASKIVYDYEQERKIKDEKFEFPFKNIKISKIILQLGRLYPDLLQRKRFVEQWFNSKYRSKISNFTYEASLSDQKILKYQKLLEQIIKELQQLKDSHFIRIYLRKIRNEYLLSQYTLGQVKIDAFIDFFQKLPQINHFHQYSKQFQDKLSSRNQQKIQVQTNLFIDKIQIQKFVQDYLHLLLKNSSDPSETLKLLNPYFEQNYLRKILAKVQLKKGQISENISDLFKKSEMEALKNKSQITIKNDNPSKFRKDEDVKLKIEVKNVKKIVVKVYQINMAKYLLIGRQNSTSQFSNEVDLSFLEPTSKQIVQICSKNSFEVVTQVIDLSQLIPRKMGVYVVDLQGENVTSRAVISKGAILCAENYTEAGQQFSFFDQSGHHLTAEEGLKVWIKNRPAELISNKAFVAYSPEAVSGQIIASAGDFAEKFNRYFEEEKYTFNVNYIYNPESFIVGRKAKIILHGRLSIKNYPMSLELLHNTKVKVIVTNFQQIKTAYDFSIVKWTNSQDPIIQFPIQSYTSFISIEVSSQVTLLSKKQIVLKSHKLVEIDLGESGSCFLNFYLDRDSKGNYRVSLLGSNGEPISNTDVTISYSIFGVDINQEKQAKTDVQGKIYLGPLSIVSRLSARVRKETSVYRQWAIDQSVNQFNYSQQICQIRDECSFPINPQWKEDDFLFYHNYTQNRISQLKFQGSRLKISRIEGEQDIQYILKILPIDKTIQIKFLKKNQFTSSAHKSHNIYDQESTQIYNIRYNLYQNVSIQNMECTQNKDNIQVKVSLNMSQVPQQDRKNIRVHVFPINYIIPEYKNSLQINSLFIKQQQKVYYPNSAQSYFYNNKIIPDEGAYVWNRQNSKQKYIGNSLQKPSILLKKQLVAETNQYTQNLMQKNRSLYSGVGGKGKVGCKRTSIRYARVGPQDIFIQQKIKNINSHNNFLLRSGEIQANLTGETIIAKVPQGYSAVEVYVVTPKSAIKRVFPLGIDRKRETRDLRHIGLDNAHESYGWTMSREIYPLKPNQKHLVSRDSQWMTVGLSEIFNFASAKGVKLYNWSSDLLLWDSYSEDKKKQVYDKECCHELNTFIRFKDPIFFDEIVGPFIKNKLQKTIVDLCLLRDPQVKDYLSIKKVHSLNPFEKCLLVYALVQLLDHQSAKKVAEILQLQQKSIKDSRTMFEQGFDSIMLQKSKNEIPRAKLNAQIIARKSGNHSGQSSDQLEQVDVQGFLQMADQDDQSKNELNCMAERKRMMKKTNAFIEIEKTKEYSERKYYQQSDQQNGDIDQSPFWVELSQHFLGKGVDFTSSSFYYFSNCVEFMLAACFISGGVSSNFQQEVESDRCAITVRTPMLMYVKELKKVECTKKFGVIMNQRFFDPSSPKAYEEDGTEYDREVDEFIVSKEYALQTVVSNTSGTPLQLQLMLDIPRGALPLRNHEYSKITNATFEPFSFQSFERFFYFPEEGTFEVCPSNAARGSFIIAKGSPLPPVVVKRTYTTNKLQSFEDVLRSGDKEQLLKYIEQRNIFDERVFRAEGILFMLKDAKFYGKVISVMRQRSFFDRGVWEFGFLHGDLAAVRDIVALSDTETLFPNVFEYFPYYCNRSHQFANEAKSTIRNMQLKETYTKFLVGSTAGLRQKDFEVAFAYFLILQDRCKEAKEIITSLSPSQYAAHELQFDYMCCFITISLSTTGFEQVRTILNKYKDYPIETWRKLFDAVRETIEAKDEDLVPEIEGAIAESFETKVIKEGAQFRVIQPAETQISIELFEINLQKYFSDYPFDDTINFTSIRPSCSQLYPSSDKCKNIVFRQSDYPQLSNVTVDVIEIKKGLPPRKVSTFWWDSSEVRVKINQNSGTLEVYVGNKRCSGAYVKVFSDKSPQRKFYRDGYTDIRGCFRYAMADIDEVKQFAILVNTEKGGSIHRVKPPSKLSLI